MSLTPFPGACTFADDVKTAYGKHLLEDFSIYFAPLTVQTGSRLDCNQTLVIPTHYTLMTCLLGLRLLSHRILIFKLCSSFPPSRRGLIAFDHAKLFNARCIFSVFSSASLLLIGSERFTPFNALLISCSPILFSVTTCGTN